MQKAVCVIPARLNASRFPKKILALLRGKPLIQWVWEAALSVPRFSKVVFAIDSLETAREIDKFKGEYFLTDERCASGTERLVELFQKKKVEGDIWVNWQGDEPFIDRLMIDTLLQSCQREESDLWTLMKKIEAPEQISSPHIAKVVVDAKGFALYFSRSTIPYYRDPTPVKNYFKHIGIYAFTSKALQKIAQLEPCALEQAEQLEQLRFLYHGLKIRVHESSKEVLGIDLPEHLASAEQILRKSLG